MYDSLAQLENDAASSDKPLWQIIMDDDAQDQGIRSQTDFNKMKSMYIAMKDSIAKYDPDLKSTSGLCGGDAGRFEAAAADGRLIAGDFITSVMEKALKVAESNACMKRIVAAPTAGSCGIVPAVLISFQERDPDTYTDDRMTEALYVAGGIGGVIASRASLSGAEGGCQAEIGSASAMAAGALTYLRGGTPHQAFNASALALKGLLGLVCDPVCGLVEVPCIKRNVIGAVNAVTSSDLSISGIESRIPADEVIDAMKSVGRMMDGALRETGKGGLAASETARKLSENQK